MILECGSLLMNRLAHVGLRGSIALALRAAFEPETNPIDILIQDLSKAEDWVPIVDAVSASDDAAKAQARLNIITICCEIAQLLFDAGRYDDADVVLRHAFALQTNYGTTTPPHHRDCARVMLLQGQCLLKLGLLQEAEQCIVLCIQTECEVADLQHVGLSHMTLAAVLTKLNRCSNALEAADTAVRLLTAQLCDEFVAQRLVSAYMLQGRIHECLGHGTDAVRSYKTAAVLASDANHAVLGEQALVEYVAAMKVHGDVDIDVPTVASSFNGSHNGSHNGRSSEYCDDTDSIDNIDDADDAESIDDMINVEHDTTCASAKLCMLSLPPSLGL
eukprot:TRINITY_DN365_c0_g1_i1.p1 TRINITY_DN365_c0_g1~~TRINITY_DN365_c0_g1_i1.p1  ORF type:complete len:332 (-),score=64.97 TRINITY_DN365_c0_g1_i1:10-1005(-)